jgi:gamma-glutamyltranspeptidase/glutathione hydrolase
MDDDPANRLSRKRSSTQLCLGIGSDRWVSRLAGAARRLALNVPRAAPFRGRGLASSAAAGLDTEMRRYVVAIGIAVTALACTRATRNRHQEPIASGSAAAVVDETSGSAAKAADPPPPEEVPLPPGGGQRTVRAERGAVTTVEPHATAAGIEILEAGGNAVDAAVAVGFALAVTHPSAGNVGGGGFMLVRPPDGETLAIDFRETAPASLTQARFDAMIEGGGRGPASVGVPGTVAGLLLVHERLGKLARAQVLAPAIHLARNGHVIGRREGLTIGWGWHDLKKDPAARVIFGRGGKPRTSGTQILRPGLAKTLQRIADHGASGFYAGPTAQAIATRLDGTLSEADLRSYQAVVRKPLGFTYRGLLVEVMPPPSAGGVVLAQVLLELQRQRAHELPAGSPEELHLFAEASRRAQAERRFGVVDPDTLTLDVQQARMARWTDPDRAPWTVPIDRARATPSRKIHPLYAAALRELEHTTHFGVIDSGGMAVSCTTTLSAGFGARIVVPSTGIVLNNAVGSFGTAGENRPAPGRRTVSSMAPTLVSHDGQVVMVLGSPGGDTIPSAIAQVFRNAVDHGMTLDKAVDAPRIHHGFVPDELRYERRRPPPQPVLETLTAMGHRLGTKYPIGDANSIVISGGVAWAYADPREGGLAAAARLPHGE